MFCLLALAFRIGLVKFSWFSLVVVLSLSAKMGQGDSKGPLSPLECLIKNFDDFRRRADGYGAPVNAFDLRKFCEREWPTFGVGWPDIGTFDLATVQAVRRTCYGNPGHPDQIPYIEVWLDILWDGPKYIKDYARAPPKGKLGQRRTKVLVATGEKIRREPRKEPEPEKAPSPPAVLPSAPEEDLPRRREVPPPYPATPLGRRGDPYHPTPQL